MTEAIEITNNVKAHRFEATLGGEIAYAAYVLKDGAMALPHTEVPEVFAGKGVGGALAKAALGYARDHGLKVAPTCSFMAGYITKHPEHHDLVREDFRARLGI
jgi:predicted GNAT family acetyltransferase